MNDITGLSPTKQYFYRNCPNCNDIMIYDYANTCARAERLDTWCQSCAITRLWAKRRQAKEDAMNSVTPLNKEEEK